MISPCCNINTTIGEIPRLPPRHENLTLAFPPSTLVRNIIKLLASPLPPCWMTSYVNDPLHMIDI